MLVAEPRESKDQKWNAAREGEIKTGKDGKHMKRDWKKNRNHRTDGKQRERERERERERVRGFGAVGGRGVWKWNRLWHFPSEILGENSFGFQSAGRNTMKKRPNSYFFNHLRSWNKRNNIYRGRKWDIAEFLDDDYYYYISEQADLTGFAHQMRSGDLPA